MGGAPQANRNASGGLERKRNPGRSDRKMVVSRAELPFCGNTRILEKSAYNAVIININVEGCRCFWKTWHGHYVSGKRNNKSGSGI